MDQSPNFNAFAALQRWASDPKNKDLVPTPAQRAELVRLADRFISVVPVIKRSRAKLGRVQALYIAGMLALLDPQDNVAPFANQLLNAAYQDEQRANRQSMKRHEDTEEANC